MSDDATQTHPAHRFKPEGDTDETTITDRFERGEAALVEALEGVEGKEIPAGDNLLRLIGEGLYDLSRIRRELRGCWTPEAQDARDEALRIRAAIAEAGRLSMRDAVERALPSLRDTITELSDRPVLRKLLEDVACGLDEARTSLHATFMVRYVGDDSEATEQEERADRARQLAEQLGEYTEALAAYVDPKPVRTALLALADELVNAPA